MKFKSKSAFWVVCIIFGYLMGTSAFAGGQTGKVTQVLVRQDGLHWFFLSGERGEMPACTKGFTYWMIKDENSTYGKSQFSILLAAHMAGKQVTISGTGACARWGDGEDIGTVILRD